MDRSDRVQGVDGKFFPLNFFPLTNGRCLICHESAEVYVTMSSVTFASTSTKLVTNPGQLTNILDLT